MAADVEEEKEIARNLESPTRLENNELDETLPPCRECERHFFARRSTFNVFDAAIVLISMFTFAADIVTDGLAASQYFVHGEAGWGCLTLGFTLVPCLVLQVFSVRWYLADEDMTGWRWIFHSCLLGPLERYVTVFETGLEARRSKDPLDFERLHHQQSDVCMLRLFESFLESAPQVVLQLYIMVATNDENLFTAVSGTVSLFSLCWAVVAYSRAHRRVRSDKKGVSWPGAILQTIWRVGMISSRVVAMVLFASAFKAYTFLVVGLHWLAMVLWVYHQQTDFCETWLEERLFNAVIGTIYVFCFFNLKEGSTRYRISAFYLLLGLENVALLLLWHEHGTLEDWYTSLGFTIVFGGFVIGVAAMILYYRFFHPGGAISLCGTNDTSEKDFCSHGRPNGRHGNIEAEIFPRSQTPSPHSSPATESSRDYSPSSEAPITSPDYPPFKQKPSPEDWQTAPSLRSKSLGCLLESEGEGERVRVVAKSLDDVTGVQIESQSADPKQSRCPCNSQTNTPTHVAADSLNRSDRWKDSSQTRSPLFKKGKSGGGAPTPFRACLRFETEGNPANQSHSRSRSQSQPIEASLGKRSKLNHSEPRHQSPLVAKIALSPLSKDPNPQGTSAEALEVSRVSSVDLRPLPIGEIDSPQTGPVMMSAHQVQSIYDHILDRETSAPISKRQLQFEEEDDKHQPRLASGPVLDLLSQVPEVAAEQAEMRSKPCPNTDLIQIGSKLVKGSVKPQRKSLNQQPTSKQDEGDSQNTQVPDGLPSRSPLKLGRPRFPAGTGSSADLKCHHPGSNQNIQKPDVRTNQVPKQNSSRFISQDNSEKSPVRSEATSQVSLLQKQDITSTLPVVTQAKTACSPNASTRTQESGHGLGCQTPDNTKTDQRWSQSHTLDRTIQNHSPASHSKTLGLPTGGSLTKQDRIWDKMIPEDEDEGQKALKFPPSAQMQDSPREAPVNLTSQSNPGSVSLTSGTKSPKTSRTSSPPQHPLNNQRPDQSRCPNADQKSPEGVLETRGNKDSVLTSLSSVESPKSSTYLRSSRMANLKVPRDVSLTPERSAVRTLKSPGKENRPLTPLRARLAMLQGQPSPSSSSSPNPSSSSKKPPRKSLGKIPNNLVADNVALFDN